MNAIAGERKTGTVKWFDTTKGFGFIDAGSEDVFVHYSDIEPQPGAGKGAFRNLDPGQAVEFEVGDGKKGPKATNVRILQPVRKAS